METSIIQYFLKTTIIIFLQIFKKKKKICIVSQCLINGKTQLFVVGAKTLSKSASCDVTKGPRDLPQVGGDTPITSRPPCSAPSIQAGGPTNNQ